ncbi:PREDICTED: uncharacterized protein C20orf85 homolog, partial [Corvus brachyrhynchos]|uniref:uncharacterized protein C20orf85 homolog n=1 Tax=Corvus brachyrhynchos TaxID=85066 RepID=UPI0008166BBA
CNFIAQDDNWKKRVESEGDAAKRWADKWGFLKTPLEELIGDEKKEDAKPKIQLPDHLQVRPVTPVEKYIKVNFANRLILQKSYGWSFRTAHTEMLLDLIPSHQSQRWKQVSPTSATKDVFLQVLSCACDEITAEA